MMLIFAGHDTTAYQISWIMVELSRNPHVVVNLRKELDQVFTLKSPTECDMEKLSELEYLSKIIKEGMRLWPVAPSLNRELVCDLPYKDFIIPQGSICVISLYAMSRHGISNPNEMIPERWDETNPEITKLNNIFMPFALGKRNCVGQALAMIELKLVLATLYYYYDFELVTEVVDEFSITLKPRNADFRVTYRVK